MKYEKYISPPWYTSILNGVPIHLLDEITNSFRIHGLKIKVRYRGPRNTPADIGRSGMARQGTCLKQNATNFALYMRKD